MVVRDDGRRDSESVRLRYLWPIGCGGVPKSVSSTCVRINCVLRAAWATARPYADEAQKIGLKGTDESFQHLEAMRAEHWTITDTTTEMALEDNTNRGHALRAPSKSQQQSTMTASRVRMSPIR